jgi:hypothetical protein
MDLHVTEAGAMAIAIATVGGFFLEPIVPAVTFGQVTPSESYRTLQ